MCHARHRGKGRASPPFGASCGPSQSHPGPTTGSTTHCCKKVWSKAIRRPASPPPLDLPFPLLDQPTKPPDNEVALPYPIQYHTYQTSSRFSRCLRPSLSSKRPLRACQCPRHRPQSSSLNEIFKSANSSTKFSQASTVSSPVSATGPETRFFRDKDSLPLN